MDGELPSANGPSGQQGMCSCFSSSFSLLGSSIHEGSSEECGHSSAWECGCAWVGYAALLHHRSLGSAALEALGLGNFGNQLCSLSAAYISQPRHFHTLVCEAFAPFPGHLSVCQGGIPWFREACLFTNLLSVLSSFLLGLVCTLSER